MTCVIAAHMIGLGFLVVSLGFKAKLGFFVVFRARH
jgi:hypothetical protein